MQGLLHCTILNMCSLAVSKCNFVFWELEQNLFATKIISVIEVDSFGHECCSWVRFCGDVLFALAASIHWCYLRNSDILLLWGNLTTSVVWYFFICPDVEYFFIFIFIILFPPIEVLKRFPSNCNQENTCKSGDYLLFLAW